MVDHRHTTSPKAAKAPRHQSQSPSAEHSPSLIKPGNAGEMIDGQRLMKTSMSDESPRFSRADRSEARGSEDVPAMLDEKNELASSGQQATSGKNQYGMPTVVLHAMTKSGVNANGYTVGVGEAKALVIKMTKTAAANPELVKMRLITPMFFWGPPGCGKSSIVERAAKVDMGIGHVDFRLSELEPVDVRGMNLPDPESGRLKLVIPNEYPDPKRGDPKYGIIMFDELSAVDRSLQVAAYRITLERNLGRSYEIPEGYYIMAAGNTKDDKAVSYTMSSALANRFCHIEIQPNPEDLISHLRSKGQGTEAEKDAMSDAQRSEAFHKDLPKLKLEGYDTHPDVPGFLSFKNEYAQDGKKGNPERGWPSGRSWERVSTICKMSDRGILSERETDIMVQGLVGAGVAVEFCSYRKLAAELPSALEILTNPKRAESFAMPDKPDQKYAMTSNMIYHMFRERNSDKDKVMAECFFTVSDKMDSDFAMMLFMETINKLKPKDGQGMSPENAERQRLITAHPDFTRKWIPKHLKSMKDKGHDISKLFG